MMNNIISGLFQNMDALLFPKVCLICKFRLFESEKYVCHRCLKRRFPNPNPDWEKSCDGILLPDHVYFQDALWRFEKESSLQHLLHALKYQGLGALGIEMGLHLGKRMKENPGFQLWMEKGESVSITGVPLHSKKMRIRGYNQAEKIAVGVGRSLNLEVYDETVLTRIRFTQTQTKYTHLQRIANMKEAFAVIDPEKIIGKNILLVDDVFTTGSTTFSCASALKSAGANQIGIITLAVA